MSFGSGEALRCAGPRIAMVNDHASKNCKLLNSMELFNCEDAKMNLDQTTTTNHPQGTGLPTESSTVDRMRELRGHQLEIV